MDRQTDREGRKKEGKEKEKKTEKEAGTERQRGWVADRQRGEKDKQVADRQKVRQTKSSVCPHPSPSLRKQTDIIQGEQAEAKRGECAWVGVCVCVRVCVRGCVCAHKWVMKGELRVLVKARH